MMGKETEKKVRLQKSRMEDQTPPVPSNECRSVRRWEWYRYEQNEHHAQT